MKFVKNKIYLQRRQFYEGKMELKFDRHSTTRTYSFKDQCIRK